jgi:hypothetical protein
MSGRTGCSRRRGEQEGDHRAESFSEPARNYRPLAVFRPGELVMAAQKTAEARALRPSPLRGSPSGQPENPLSILSLPTRLCGETLGMRFGGLTRSLLWGNGETAEKRPPGLTAHGVIHRE